MAKVLILGFKTSTGRNFSISVNRPALTIEEGEIKSAMETIIAQKCIGANVTQADGTKDYQLANSIGYAKYVTTEDTEFDFEA